MNLVATGDEQAFTQLFNFHRDGIYSTAYRFTRSPDISEEIVQDVFLQIWLKRAGLQHIQNFSAYLFVVTQHNAYRALKLIARNYESVRLTDAPEPGADNDALNKLMEKESRLLLQNGIERLPRQQEKVFRLMKQEGMRRQQVADLLHLKPETIKFHLSEAMKNLRAFCKLHVDLFVIASILVLRLR